MQEKIEPAHIRALVAYCSDNYAAAAAAMGVSPSTVSRALQTNETTLKQEARAGRAMAQLQHEAEQRQRANAAPINLMISVPADKHDAFHKVVEVMGLELLGEL